MMIDPFVLLTPVLLLAVFWLVRFIGCNEFYGLEPTEPETRPATPAFDPESMTLSQQISVTLSSDSNATIFYSTKNAQEEPIPSTLYSGPITVSYTTTIRAIATAPDKNTPSLEGTATYVMLPITYRQPAGHETLPSDAGANVISDPFSDPVLAGSLMAVWLWYNNTAQSVATVTDTAGNAYQRAVGPTNGVGALAGWRQEIWYGNIVTGGNLRVTANFTQAFTAKKSISIHEYSGAHQTEPLDKVSQNAASNASPTSGSVTTTAARLIFGAAIFAGQGGADTINGFSLRAFFTGNIAEDKPVTAPGPIEAKFKSAVAQAWIAQMAAFK